MRLQLPKLRRPELTPMPLSSPCYCAECKRPLTPSRILDERSAWCADCQDIVDVSCFQVEGWIMGVIVFLMAHLQFSSAI